MQCRHSTPPLRANPHGLHNLFRLNGRGTDGDRGCCSGYALAKARGSMCAAVCAVAPIRLVHCAVAGKRASHWAWRGKSNTNVAYKWRPTPTRPRIGRGLKERSRGATSRTSHFWQPWSHTDGQMDGAGQGATCSIPSAHLLWHLRHRCLGMPLRVSPPLHPFLPSLLFLPSLRAG